jgi:hypothetical protein
MANAYDDKELVVESEKQVWDAVKAKVKVFVTKDLKKAELPKAEASTQTTQPFPSQDLILRQLSASFNVGLLRKRSNSRSRPKLFEREGRVFYWQNLMTPTG